MPKIAVDDQVQGSLCDLLKILDQLSLETVARCLKGNASPHTINIVENLVEARSAFEHAVTRQYGDDHDLTETEIYIMHNDPRDPGPDAE